jgi:hypothetical protein
MMMMMEKNAIDAIIGRFPSLSLSRRAFQGCRKEMLRARSLGPICLPMTLTNW